MGQANCKSPENLPASPEARERLTTTEASLTAIPSITQNTSIDEFLAQTTVPANEVLSQLAELTADGRQVLATIRGIYSYAEARAQKVQPLGDWSFAPKNPEPVVELAEKTLQGLNLSERLRSCRGMHRNITTSATENSTTNSAKEQSKIITDNQLFLLTLASVNIAAALSNSSADLLFSLNTDGESWGRFLDRVDGYKGPIIVLIKLKEPIDRILGAYMPEGLCETGSQFAGSADSFLFSIAMVDKTEKPTLTVRRASNFEKNYYMMNRSSQYSAKGLSFGGDDREPRVLIDSDFRRVSVLLACRTYESGSLLFDEAEEYSSQYDLDDLEVWGFGGAEALRAQSAQKALHEDLKSERRKIDIAKMIGNDPTGLFKKNVKAGERQGEADVIIEEREREREAKESDRL